MKFFCVYFKLFYGFRFVNLLFVLTETQICSRLENNSCLMIFQCNKPYPADDLIPINPDVEETEKLKYRIELRREQHKLEKKAAKDAKKRPADSKDDAAPSKAPKTKASTSASHTAGFRGSLSKTDPDVLKLTKTSVAKDPSASEVFKSLFTSSDNAKKQDHAHWVTHNPFYN